MEIVEEWVEPWLDQPFYAREKCSKHTKYYNTVFYVTCLGDLFCDYCLKDSNLYNDNHHKILHVRRASERAFVEVEEIRKFLDVSKFKCIVLITKVLSSSSRMKEPPTPLKNPIATRVVEGSLKKNQFKEYKFCSIVCKVRINKHDMKIKQQPSLPSMKINSDQRCYFVSLRKRSRKGIPHRAPLQ